MYISNSVGGKRIDRQHQVTTGKDYDYELIRVEPYTRNPTV